jgi:cellulose synthase/poly-beta-1,6-N-acetylglucosamine synthase-like glycosyltransferase
MISHLIELALTVLIGAFTLQLFVLLLQALAFLSLREQDDDPGSAPRTSIAVIVPAHNEAQVIGHAIASIREQTSGRDRIVVVADNCSDETYDVAKQAGAEVVIRCDLRRIGRDYPIAAAVKFLTETGPRDVVVILDADCVLGPGALDKMARACTTRGAPIQTLYLMSSSAASDSSARVTVFGWRIKTYLRPLGYSRLGMPCNLMGPGTALPWNILHNIKIGRGHIADDISLGFDFALQGHPPWLCPSAYVKSEFPRSQRGRDDQRKRWVHGYFAVVQSYFLRLIVHSIRKHDVYAFALAVDLLVLPLGGLAVFCFVIACAASVLLLTAGWFAFFLVSTFNLVLLSLFMTIAWHTCGRDLIGLQELATLPNCLLSTIRIFAEYVTGKRATWVRAERT